MFENRRINFSLVFCLILVCLFLYSRKSKNSEVIGSQEIISDDVQDESLSAIARRPVQVSREVIKSDRLQGAQDSADAKAECYGIYSWMATKSAPEIEMELSQVLKANESSCVQLGIPGDNITLERCQNNDRQELSEQQFKGRCRAVYVGLRARAISELYNSDDDYRNMNLTVLLNMIWDWHARHDLTKEQSQKYQSMTRALMERRPKDVEVLKVHANSLDFDNLSSPEKLKYQNAVIERGLSMAPQDRTLIEQKLAVAYFSKNQNTLQDFIRTNPQDSTGHYYYGTYLWSQGRKQEALQHLGQAAKLDPQSSRYQSAVEKLKTSPPTNTKPPIEIESTLTLEFD